MVQEGEGEDLKTTTVALPGVRTHWGLIAQDVKKAVDASGVEDFAGYVVDDMDEPRQLPEPALRGIHRPAHQGGAGIIRAA